MQAAPCVVDHLRVCVDEFVLEDCQLLIVEVELELQRVIRHPAAPLEKSHDLVEDVIQVHPSPSLPEDSITVSPGLHRRCSVSSLPILEKGQQFLRVIGIFVFCVATIKFAFYENIP